jgi:hypothetical protein
VYDFEAFDQPNTIEWFKVKNIETRTADRDYIVEHILEWQMYLRFLMGKRGKTNKENGRYSAKANIQRLQRKGSTNVYFPRFGRQVEAIYER